MLHVFIAVNRAEIIRRCPAKVASRSMSPPTGREIEQGVPVFLDQVVNALRLGLSSSREIGPDCAPACRVMPIEPGVAIEADRQVLAAVVGNLQNAFTFTPAAYHRHAPGGCQPSRAHRGSG